MKSKRKYSRKRKRPDSELPLSLRFIAGAQDRVLKQKQLIAHLKVQGQPTTTAEAMLKRYETLLLQARNHSDLMQVLLEPDQYRPHPIGLQRGSDSPDMK